MENKMELSNSAEIIKDGIGPSDVEIIVYGVTS